MRFHSYLFFDSVASLTSLSATKLKAAKKDFVQIVSKNKKVRVRSYATLALKANILFMLHINADSPDDIQLFARDLLHTDLGKHLKITYALLGMTRASQYNPKNPPKESAPEDIHRYLVVYPFTKTTEWHLKPYEDRRAIMWGHVQVGKKFSKNISQLLLYSYGIDDHEFIVSYQMNSLEEFQTLVMELRADEGRRYTKNDLPIFTCIRMPLAETLEML